MKNKSLLSLLTRVCRSPSLRFRLSLYLGLILNIFYLSGNIHSALAYRSLWSATVTIYHTIFIIIRLYLLSADGDKEIPYIRSVCRRVGLFLLLLDLAAAVMMLYTVRSESFFRYSGVVLLAFFTYTVYSLSSSILGMKRYVNDKKPLHFVARNITLAAAMMSLFNLQYSFLTSLGAGIALTYKLITVCGFGVFLVIIILAVRLIVKTPEL